jgi:hypothetical protein
MIKKHNGNNEYKIIMCDKIKCQICNAEMKRITKTHLKKHDIDTDKYDFSR